MQPTGQIAEQRVARVGGDPADDELMARDADDQALSALEQRLEPAHEPLGGGLEVGVPVGIHRALVEHDRELDQEIGQVAGERGNAH